jgi:hypothetical protein
MTLTIVATISLALAALAAAQENRWRRFVNGSGTFSFQYPPGWTVVELESNITVSNAATGEEILILALTQDRTKSPAGHAGDIFAVLRRGTPDLRVTRRAANDAKADFDMTYSREGNNYSGSVSVIKGEGQAVWFSYSAPSARYDRAAGAMLLQTVLSTVTTGTRPPPIPPSPGLTGTWSTSHISGDIVDEVTGTYQRGAFSGELFLFREDGSFRHVVIGSGQIISGVASEDGAYVVSGGILTLRSTSESWLPDPTHHFQKAAYKNKPMDKTAKYGFRFQDAQTLILVEAPYQSELLLHKQPSPGAAKRRP